jgi:hypothetical protein
MVSGRPQGRNPAVLIQLAPGEQAANANEDRPHANEAGGYGERHEEEDPSRGAPQNRAEPSQDSLHKPRLYRLPLDSSHLFRMAVWCQQMRRLPADSFT